MALSTQRLIIVIFMLKLLVIPAILTIAGGNSIENFENQHYNTLIENQFENQEDFETYILERNLDPDKNYIESELGSSSIGIKKSYVGNLLSTGLSNWIPLGIANDEFERMFLIFINVFSIIITLLASYELFQIIWGKKTN